MATPDAPLARWAQVAVEVARGAGAILRDGFGQIQTIHFKGAIDLVTDTDRASEAYIAQALRRHFPDHGLLGEEGTDEQSDSPFRWVIDPLDGTTNYAHGYPMFCVSLALMEGELPVIGVVYQPIMDELFVAVRGQGATLNGRIIRVSDVAELNRSLLATGFPYGIYREAERHLALFNRFVIVSQAVRRDGSAALDLAYVACGRFEGFWEAGLAPWDKAAGALLIEEAGGCLSDYQGGSFEVFGETIVASNGRIHPAILDVIAGKSVS